MKLKHSPVPGLGQSEGWQHVFFGHARGSVYQDWGRHCAAGRARVRPCIVIIVDGDDSQPSQAGKHGGDPAWPGRDHRPAECPSSTLPMRRLRCVSVLCSSRPNLGSSQLYNCWCALEDTTVPAEAPPDEARIRFVRLTVLRQSAPLGLTDTFSRSMAHMIYHAPPWSTPCNGAEDLAGWPASVEESFR